MSIQEMWKENKAFRVGVTCGLVVVAAVVLLIQTGVIPPSTVVGKFWYYDLATEKLFAADDQIPPIRVPTGPKDGPPTGVRAYVFACGECSDASKRVIGYLETFDPEVHDEIVQGTPTYAAATGSDVIPGMQKNLIKRPTDKEWIGGSTPEGIDLKLAATPTCADGNAPKTCDGP
ncbi:MAG: hypothetical protein NTW19_23785 [Planctomycetota bacterium]|nr:hypothetical protein [Planctomycetota bacterium]